MGVVCGGPHPPNTNQAAPMGEIPSAPPPLQSPPLLAPSLSPPNSPLRFFD